MTLEDWIRGSKVRDFQSIEEKNENIFWYEVGMVTRKRAKIMAILYFLFILFCFGISAIFAPSNSKLYYFLFKCWFTTKIWLKKCFPLTLPLEINILTFSWHFWKKAGNSNLKIKLKKWLTDNRIWKTSWYFEFEKWDHFWKA